MYNFANNKCLGRIFSCRLESCLTEVNQLCQPPLPPRNKTEVSLAALKYEASEHIKRLAKHRPTPKVDDEKKCFMVKPLSLIYKPSLPPYPTTLQAGFAK
ncbi:unnamed protein product [Macrosiphum euphorbiae]|uniref:Uncharacterized protein n=1 Tax=Macrosiphum euphorbiae TaxID=13131 RepID=A0AAV0XGV3_9HEMI|nr:unnamed protein product [Macrosiphum euphorbiae]